ncbi:MAG: alcohol dehydrogenase catalytic domain-containing protein [Deltaproteobacteria bacterium]|nr:alcohol dehydrogenase catalytic domain-containing protein [Deltaproteobacteria bacterium]
MRALRVGDGAVRLREHPQPAATPGEALVRVTLSGICNTDLELVRGYAGFAGTIGHEFVGVVEDPGGGDLPRGARVVGEINAGCGACAGCARGDARHCPARTVLGIVGRDGAHADYLRLPARNLVRVPDGVRDEHAVFVEPLAAACGVLERCPEAAASSARVAVIGDGKLGLLCAMALAAAGGAPVLVGKHAAKLAIAAARGIATTDVAGVRARGRAFDVVVEATGGAAGFELALDLLVPQGTLVLKSTFHGGTPVDAARIVVEELRVVGSRCGRFAPALDLLARGAVDLDPLISETLPLDRAEHALARAAAPGVLKVLLAT